MKKIIGLGNSLVDILIPGVADEVLCSLGLPKGSMQLVERPLMLDGQHAGVMRSPGGSAANTIKALAAEGVPVGFVGKVGNDGNGSFFVSALRALGVATHIATAIGDTGVATTFISPDGERTFATCLGVSGTLGVDDISSRLLGHYDVLYVEGYMVQNHSLTDHVMSAAKQQGLEICLDLASYNVVESDREFFRHLLTNYVDIVFANQEEALAFTGKPNASAQEGLAVLASLCPLAIVKIGDKGSIARRRGEERSVTAQAVKVDKVVDTTGAGDFFAAGFLSAYIRQETLAACLQSGNREAAQVIQIIGTSPVAPNGGC